jgi:hypothetical protein
MDHWTKYFESWAITYKHKLCLNLGNYFVRTYNKLNFNVLLTLVFIFFIFYLF